MRIFFLSINVILIATCSSYRPALNEGRATDNSNVKEGGASHGPSVKEDSSTHRSIVKGDRSSHGPAEKEGSDRGGSASDKHTKPETDACGDATVTARYDKCLKATGETACLAAGGSWKPVGLSHKPICLCPTGQGNCPCVRSTDCLRASDGLGACTAPFSDETSRCKGVTEGTCASVYPFMGCYCWFDADGNILPLCVD